MITVIEGENNYDRVAAGRILEQMKEKSNAVIGLSTGRTTGNMHRIVVEEFRKAPFDISGLTLFGIDELTGVPREYFGSCYTMLHTQIIDDLGMPDGQFIILPTESDDFSSECKRFNEELRRRGGIDLIILGLGENGHLGINQPGSSFDSETRVTKMHQELEDRVRKETNAPADKPLGGATLGIKEIMSARKIILVAKGDNKAEIVDKIINGPICEEVPGSILQRHPDCEYLLDDKAAKFLNRK